MPHSHRMPYSRSTERLHYGLDFEYLMAAFSWIPALDQATSSDERQHWVSVRLRLLESFLATFPLHQGRGDHYEGQSYRAERELLSSTAQILLQLRPEEEPSRFWKPLFNLGTSAQPYRAPVGCPWRDLPGEYGDHHTVYMRWKHWVKSGVPQRALVASYLEAAQRGELDLSLAMADSTIVRARQHAAEAHKKTAATRRPAARVAG